MTSAKQLTQHWNALQGVAPDLLLPITDDESLARVTQAVRWLSKEIQARGSGPHPLDDLVELVMAHITAYETAHFPIPDPDGADMLVFMLEQRGLSQHELARATGLPQSTISNLLRRKRPFTVAHARTLAKYFGGDVGMWLGGE